MNSTSCYEYIEVTHCMLKLQRRKRVDSMLGKLLWTYFILLIFEGSIRKWIVPSLSAPLLIVRDPISVCIVWESIRTHQWPKQWSVITGLLTVVFSLLLVIQIVWWNNVWIAGLYGMRSYLLPFPVAFALGEYMDMEDVKKIARYTMYIMVVMVFIYTIQYRSSSGSAWNAGAYEGATQIMYAGDHVRASGTFSYNVGATYFSLLGFSFILYGIINRDFVSRWLLMAALFSLVVSVPLVGARTLVYLLAVEAMCAIVCYVVCIGNFTKSIRYIIPVIALTVSASFLPVFSDATNSLAQRFVSAGASEGNTKNVLTERSMQPFVDAVTSLKSLSDPLGVGMGRGAAAVTALLEGKASFVAGESEIFRNIIELGPYIGILYALYRVLLAIYLLALSIQKAKNEDALALLLAPLMVITTVWGVMEMPTFQGFMVLSIALTLASLK